MWIAGLIGLGIAGFCGYLVFTARQRQHEMIITETMTARELMTLQAAAAQAAGAGFFRQKCELVGVAQPGPAGTITSELSSTECLWHRHVVIRKYWETERRRDSDGSYSNRRVEKKEKVAERESEQPFHVTDDTGSVLVHPAGALQDMKQVVSRFEPHDSSDERTELSIGKLNLSLPNTRREGTIGYEYEEWVLEAGRKLYVLGEATDDDGELGVTSPSMISTKDEETLLHEARKKERLALIAGAVAAVAGVVLIVADLLA